jgi:hypothetical protein
MCSAFACAPLLVYLSTSLLPVPYNARLHPEGAIVGGIAQREDSQNQFHIPPGERTEIQINRKVLPIIFFAEGPKVVHDSIGELIIHAQEHTAGCGAAFAIDNCLEAVTALNLEGWIYCPDVTVIGILWNDDQAGTEHGRSVFQLRTILPQDKALWIPVDARAGQHARAAEPLGRARIGNQVIDRPAHCRSLYLDIHPERSVGREGRAEEFASFVPQVPVAAIISFDERRDEIHAQVNGVTRRDLDR